MFSVNIYIESNLKGFRRQQGIYGVIIEYFKSNGEPVTREIFGKEDATYNQITLIALQKALKILNKECICHIFTDNAYVKNNIEIKTYEAWEKKDWKNGKSKDIANKELWKVLIEQLRRHKVIFSDTENTYKSWLNAEIAKREHKEEEAWK